MSEPFASRSLSTPQSPTPQLDNLPPILSGRSTVAVERNVGEFYLSIADIFERWIARRSSPHTKRSYRQDVASFIEFRGIRWPEESTMLLRVSVADIQAWRDEMVQGEYAPKTISRRISSLSSFYRFLQGVAAELRLPITVPNPAHAQFIGRSGTDPLYETKALSARQARQLMGLPIGESLIGYRDRAILKFFLYSGARIGTGCRLKVCDIHRDREETTIRLHEKGGKRRTIGLHVAAAEAITEYVDTAGISNGPLFRPRLNSRSCQLANRPMHTATMYRIIQGYLSQLPGTMQPVTDTGGHPPESDHPNARFRCVYTPHSLRATTATLLLDAKVDIMKVKELLGHRHVTTTQIYDKRRLATKESASHDVPI
ncbi:Tyrosine recombinase XerC [Symmachiella dynata]|uniref:Tyrosine recombinase XerC n=1 Tax=Symmachiella dynata TaxID=2527995 RepID=A0A517ZK63_9PLAN|nr:tyrosine-type recombinase/integrase [Symmachiella dynata]QDU42892.1 Tyrosine recombinase XerC [Symmachiella dynata]